MNSFRGKEGAHRARFLAATLFASFVWLLILVMNAGNAQCQILDLDSILVARSSQLIAVDLHSRSIPSDSFQIVWPPEMKQRAVDPRMLGVPQARTASVVLALEQVHGEIRMAREQPSLLDTLVINLSGLLIKQSGSHSERFSQTRSEPLFASEQQVVGVTYGKHDLVALSHSEPGSFWRDVAEPVLVVIGAAAIVALFFLVRS